MCDSRFLKRSPWAPVPLQRGVEGVVSNCLRAPTRHAHVCAAGDLMPPHHPGEHHRQATQAGLPAQDRRWWRPLPKLGCSAATLPMPTLALVDYCSSPEQREHSFYAPTHRCFSTPPSPRRFVWSIALSRRCCAYVNAVLGSTNTSPTAWLQECHSDDDKKKKPIVWLSPNLQVEFLAACCSICAQKTYGAMFS